jgi:hypothetical protein
MRLRTLRFAPGIKGTVLRGTDRSAADIAQLGQLKAGDSLVERGFVAADKYSPHSGNVQYVIEGGGAADLDWMRAPDNSLADHEALFGPNSKFELTEDPRWDEQKRTLTIIMKYKGSV